MKKTSIIVLVLIFSLALFGCVQMGIERGERIAIVIKIEADEELERFFKEIERVIKEGVETFGYPVTMIKFIPPDSFDIAGTRPKPALLKQIPENTDKLFIAILTERKQELSLSWRTISMKTRRCVARKSQRIFIQNKEKFLEFLCRLVQGDLIDIKK